MTPTVCDGLRKVKATFGPDGERWEHGSIGTPDGNICLIGGVAVAYGLRDAESPDLYLAYPSDSYNREAALVTLALARSIAPAAFDEGPLPDLPERREDLTYDEIDLIEDAQSVIIAFNDTYKQTGERVMTAYGYVPETTPKTWQEDIAPKIDEAIAICEREANNAAR